MLVVVGMGVLQRSGASEWTVWTLPILPAIVCMYVVRLLSDRHV